VTQTRWSRGAIAVLLFWLVTFAAVPLALLVPPGAVRWTAIAWLGLIGVINALVNWVILVWLRRGSMAPLLGLCLAIAVFAVPPDVCGRWILFGALLDPWVPLNILAGITRVLGVRLDEREEL
jgi:hypothetical protein